MTGLITGIKRGEIHDGDGIRTTVFFKGCTLKCIWCHNPESISFDKQIAFFGNKCLSCGACGGEKNEHTAALCPSEAISYFGREYSVDELVDELLGDVAFFCNGGGVTLSGGECLAQIDFACGLSKALSGKGVSVFVDTCGYVKREALDRIIPYTDKFLYDIKAISPEVHKLCTGHTNELILDNFVYLCSKGCDLEVRYPLVVGYNDCECERIADFLKKHNFKGRVKVLQYHSFAASRYAALGMNNTLPDTSTSFDDVEEAVSVLKKYGIYAVNGISES